MTMSLVRDQAKGSFARDEEGNINMIPNSVGGVESGSHVTVKCGDGWLLGGNDP